MKIIILAGGSGTRLWPLSRRTFPKQFLKLGAPLSFLQQTLLRALALVKPEEIFIITHNDYAALVCEQMQEMDLPIVNNILLEPSGKNTAPSLAFAVKELIKRGYSLQEPLLVMPSDHLLSPVEAFSLQVREALDSASSAIVTFGLYPTRPEIGYGYIQKRGEELLFIEKPTLKRAQELLLEGNVFWNAGIFFFSIAIFLEEVFSHARMLYHYIENQIEYELLEAISFDYAVMEHSTRIKMFPLHLTWSDVGSWQSLYELAPKDKNKNVLSGNIYTCRTEDSLIYAESRHVATLGVKGLCIVETSEGILVMDRSEAENVKFVPEATI